MFYLTDYSGNGQYVLRLSNFFLNQTDAEIVIDIIELCFQCMTGGISSDFDFYASRADKILSVQRGLLELNNRFQENGVGYQFEQGQINVLKILKHDESYLFKERLAIQSSRYGKETNSSFFTNGLVPAYTKNQFTSLISLVESRIPTIRNKVGRHSQGEIPQSVDDGLTRYGMNLTGSNIFFLIEQSGL